MTKTRWTLVGAASAAALFLAAAPRAARAYRTWQAERRQARIAQAMESVKRGQDYLTFNPVDDEQEESADKRLPEQDDPMLRGLVNAAEWGYPSPAFSAQKLAVARAEARKWAALMPRPARLARRIDGSFAGAPALAPTGAGPTWASLGPTDTAKKEYNGDEYVANDTGRGQTIRVDPTDATGNTIYFAVSGGGVWRTTDFNAPTPTWVPLTDSIGDLSIGAMDLYAAPGATSDQLTIWAGLGDAFDAPSGLLVFSRDSGATWSAGIQLTGQYNNGGGMVEPQPASPATRIRDIRVDPNNPDIVLVASEVGLYRSTNGTSAFPTFSLIDLENNGTTLLKESAWSFAYLGAAAGAPSQWLLSGVYACLPATGTAAYANVPPGAGGGVASSTTCPNGNLGDIWKSADGGATWTSARKAGPLGSVTGANLTLGQELGRMQLAAGTPVAGDPSQTVVYVQAGNMNEALSRQAATFRTTDSGASYAMLAKDTGAVTNPTYQPNSDCSNMNVAHGQAWYNLAISVDPSDSNHAIQGGNLCAVRTIDGGATWQAVADWLPLPGFGAFGISQGNTDPNFSVYLPYVHADWHAITVGANGRVYAGTDGGFFSSDNVFTSALVDATNMPIAWRQVNTGLVTHLHYSIASGDPVLGNHRFTFTGLQDNGTRIRDSGTSTKWNQVVGGDGVAAAISVWDDGSHQVFFHSLPGRRQFCRPGEPFFIAGSFDPAINIDCNTGLLHPNQGADDLSTEWTTWNRAANPNLPNGDSEPFLLRIIPVNDGKGTMFTISSQYAWTMRIDEKDVVNYQQISNIFANRTTLPAAAVRSPRGMIQVSPWTYTSALPDGAVGSTDRTIQSRLYGVPLSGGWFYVGVENSFDTSNWVQQPWSWTSSQTVLGSTGTGGLQQMSSTSSIDFPHDPTHLGGAAPVFPTDLLKTYIVSSVTPVDLANQLIRDDVGRIFKTINSGTTWTSIAPVSSGMPNIPVSIVRFDPGDATDQTIWAGTDIGVYVTFNGGTSWERYGNGFPMVRVTDMSFARNGSLLRVATYGRGIWEIYPHQRAATTAGSGDWDLNGAIDFIDLAAAASRLGKTSASTAQPGYDYNLDTDASDSLDDADLTALLAKYGSTP